MSGREIRETSVSELLEYKISYDDDGALQWHPPVGSKELAIALSYYFPEERDIKEKMRAAIKGFLRDQRKIIGNVLQAEAENKSRQSVEAGNQHVGAERRKIPDHFDLQVLPWDPIKKIFKGNPRRTKRRYGKIEGAKVAANRGNVCDYHRKKKLKCDPDSCPQNKLRLQNLAESRENIAGSTILSNDLASKQDLQGYSRSSISNSSNAARRVDQCSEDDVAYLAQNYTELVMEPDLAISNNDFSHWTPGSSVFHAGETDQQCTVGTYEPIATDLYFTLPAVITEDLEHITKMDASPTNSNGTQERVIRNYENHIVDLMKANNELEQEISALEKSWLDIDVGRGVSSASVSGGPLLAMATCGVSSVFYAAAALASHRALTFRLRQIIRLEEKLSSARSAFERRCTELKTVKEKVECLQAARDLEADLPSLQREVDRELELAFQKISL